MTPSVHRTSLFAGILVTNLAASVDWYSRLFGAEPSFRPDDTEAVWQLEERQFVYLKSGQGTPGGSLVTILVANLDGYLAAAAVRGVTPVDREEYGAGVSKAVFNDPDGNEFGVGTVPPDQM